MKKLPILILCLLLLAGCVPVPYLGTPQAIETAAAEPAPARTDAPAPSTAAKTPGPKATASRRPTAAPTVTATPTPTATPAPTPTPKPTAPPTQTYTGAYFRFQVPGSWLRAKVSDGVYFYPDANDTRHTYLMYQESPNEMQLTETSLDIALLFSSKESITAMVEGSLTDSGMTNFRLSPLTVEKTQLNGYTCYRGASDILMDGETYDFLGHIFLRGSKMVLLVWVGDQTKYADRLADVYGSLQALR